MMGGGGMMGGYSNGIGMMGSAGLFGGLLMLLFWVFVIAGIVWLVLAITQSQRGGRGAEPQTILSERLARGEIDAEEYRTRLAALRDGAR